MTAIPIQKFDTVCIYRPNEMKVFLLHFFLSLCKAKLNSDQFNLVNAPFSKIFFPWVMINVNKTPFTDDLFKYKTRTRKNAKYTTHNEILKQGKIHHTSEPQKQSIRTTIYEIKTYTNLSFIISIIVNPRKPCEIQHSHIILLNDIIENFRNSNE